MAIEGYFFDAVKTGDTYDRTYSAGDFTSYLDLLVGNGVFPNPSTNLQVIANNTMGCIVKTGAGWIKGHKIKNTADLPLRFNTSDITLNRIDSVVFYVDYINREMGIGVKEGVKGINVKAPDLQRDATRYEMCLANVFIDKQVTEITQSNIVDTRGLTSRCGWVKGLIEQVDTETLFIQWQDAYEKAIKDNENKYKEWFEQVKEHVASIATVKTYKKIYQTGIKGEKTIPVGIPQYNYALDILEVYINGLRLNSNEYTCSGDSIVLNRAIYKIGTPIEFVVYKTAEDETVKTQIDELEIKKADKKATSVTLLAGNWNNGRQEVTVSGVGVNDILIVDAADRINGIFAEGQALNKISFSCQSTPKEDVSVNILNLGAEI